MQEQETTPVEETTATSNTDKLQYAPSKSAYKRIKKMSDRYMDMFKQQRLDNARLKKHESVAFKNFKKQVGNELYASLKTGSMVTYPEVLNEDGTVKTISETVLDKSLFMRQLKLATVVLKEGRIKDGKRSKTTGRTSDRSMQSSNVDAVKQAIQDRLEIEKPTTLTGS